jgi:hypothetical protein
MISEAFRVGKSDIAAELLYRYMMEDKIVELSRTLNKRVSEGERGFSIEILKNTKDTRVLFQNLVDKHTGVFDKHIFSHILSALSEHEVNLLMVIDDNAIRIQIIILTKM